MIRFKNVILLFVFIALISSIIYSQNYIEAHAIKKKEMLYFVPKKEHLAYTNFGFKSVIADLLWLRGVSYFMFHINSDNDYKYLCGMFEASVALDPKFTQVYRDSMSLLLSDKEYYVDAEKILLFGLSHFPQDWELNYLAGILYAFYLKNDEKSLRHFEKSWAEIPRTDDLKGELYTITVMVRAITEKKNDKNGLILYWKTKYSNQNNKDSKEYCATQIRIYTSKYMEDKLNEIHQSQLNTEEKNIKFNEEIVSFNGFYLENNLNEFINVPLNELFGKTDAFGYPWVFSERKSKLYSFGIAHEYLSRKINLLNIKLWERLQKKISISLTDLFNYNPEERVKHIKLKPEYRVFPSWEEIYDEKDDWLHLEVPLFPIYDKNRCVFIVPEYTDLKNIDKKYK
jgi:hypothetical protein